MIQIFYFIIYIFSLRRYYCDER